MSSFKQNTDVLVNESCCSRSWNKVKSTAYSFLNSGITFFRSFCHTQERSAEQVALLENPHQDRINGPYNSL